MPEDRRYLITRGNRFWLQVASPQPLHGRFRKLVQRTLETTSLREAQSRRWAVLNGFRRAWEQAAENPNWTSEDIDRAAEAAIAEEKARDAAWQ